MTTMIGSALAMVQLGIRVDRAAAALPATTASPIFNVIGGRVAVFLLGQVVTIIQAQANATKLIANPTVGSDVDLCATADINALEAGGLLMPVGAVATALGKALAGGIAMADFPSIVAVGTIDLSCAATNTGTIKWTAFYIPIDDGAYVTAA